MCHLTQIQNRLDHPDLHRPFFTHSSLYESSHNILLVSRDPFTQFVALVIAVPEGRLVPHAVQSAFLEIDIPRHTCRNSGHLKQVNLY